MEIHEKSMGREHRREATELLIAQFSSLPDKKLAWEDLLRLTQDEDIDVRLRAINALGLVFSQVSNKTQAWKYILRLTQDEYIDMRCRNFALELIQIPDKAEDWECLIVRDWNRDANDVRWGAAYALGLVFSQVPDKAQAWQDLHRLTQDKYSTVRMKAAYALGSAFSHVPDKDQAWQDLDRLTKDSDSGVRSRSLYSLGKSSIFKATETENDESFREYLVQAIDFFERSSKEGWYNLAVFCLPLYRSFYFITFRGLEAQSEANRYLIEAKNAIEQSKSKEVLFEAVESLSQALVNVQKAKDATIQDRQIYLDALRRSCERAACLVFEANDRTPGAAKTIERGLHIIKGNIRAELAEIEKNSFRLLEATRSTPFESITNRTVERIRGLSGIEYGFNAESIMDDVVPDLIVMCSFLPEKSREAVCGLMNWDALDFEEKVLLFKRAITYCANQMEHFSMRIKDKDDQITYLRNEVLVRLENINFHIFKINIRSGDVAQSLRALECELQKIKKIKDDLDRV